MTATRNRYMRWPAHAANRAAAGDWSKLVDDWRHRSSVIPAVQGENALAGDETESKITRRSGIVFTRSICLRQSCPLFSAMPDCPDKQLNSS
jgi:hypothetical protein